MEEPQDKLVLSAAGAGRCYLAACGFSTERHGICAARAVSIPSPQENASPTPILVVPQVRRVPYVTYCY